jgi:type IV pilus assembly protein PilE
MHVRHQGFSLIELMIVVVIIGVIAGIGFPLYKKNVADAQRKAAQTALLELANAMERHKLRTGTYLGSADANGVPKIFATQAPLQGEPKSYNLTIDADVSSYELYAKPIAGSAQSGNGGLSLNNKGERKWEKDGDGTGYLYDWDGDIF